MAAGSVTSADDLFVISPPYAVGSVDAAVRIQFGQPQTVNVTADGHVALVLFDGAPGRRISIDVSGTTSAAYTLYHPNGALVASGWLYPPTFVDAISVDTPATYTLLFDPSAASGSLTFTVFDIPPDATATAVIGGSAVTWTTTTPGQNARVTFTGQAGQHVGVQLSNLTIASTYWSIRQPNSQRITEEDWVTSTDSPEEQFLDAVLPVSGIYSVYFDPDDEDTGSVTVIVSGVANDVAGTIVPGGPPVTITTTSAGQNASLTFTGTAGQRVALLMTNFSTMGYWTNVSVVRPDGVQLIPPAQLYSGRDFRDAVSLPMSGTYTIVIDPSQGHIGSITVTLFDVPPDLTGTMSIGGAPQTVTLSPAQNASFTFSGTAGQQVTLQLTAVTINQSNVSILNPDGTLLAVQSVGTAGGSILDKTLPATGTYTIVEDPQRDSAGNMTLTLLDAGDITGTITPGGSPVTVTITVPGQKVRLTFNGSAQQRVSLLATNVTISSAVVSLLKPDGTTLASTSVSTSGAFLDTMTLPVAGSYTVLVTPSGSATGSLTLTLYNVVDVTGPITMGAAAPVSIGTPGQNARLTFTVTAGQRVSLQATAVSGATGTMAILKPDGTTQVSATVGSSGAFIDGTVLALDGTYTVLADPSGTNTGSLTLTLRDTNDVTGTLTPGTAFPVTISNAGQNARLTFDGTSGRKVSLNLTSVTIGGSTTVAILKPDGTTLASRLVGTTGGFIDAQTLPVTGTYTVLIDPSSTNTGNITITLYDFVDVSGPLTIGVATPVSIGTPGQNARLTFSATAGQRVSLQATGVSGATGTMAILRPDGTTQVSATVSTSGAFIDGTTLIADGIYTALVDPSGTNTGSLTLTLRDASDITGTITPGGSPVTVTISNAGQNARLTFSGTSGQRVSLRATSVTIPSSTVAILNPDGTTLGSVTSTTSGAFLDTKTLATTGTYTVLVDPSTTNTGNMTLTLYDVPADVTGTLTVNGGGVPITITTPGQNASFTFAGTASQLVTVRITANTDSTITVKLMKPDGTQQTSATSSASSFNLTQQTLATTGTYTIVVDPSQANTGGLTVAVTNP